MCSLGKWYRKRLSNNTWKKEINIRPAPETLFKLRKRTILWKILTLILFCVVYPLLLTAACKHQGTEETSCWTFARGMSSRSCLLFHDVPTVFSWWKVWTACRTLQHPDCSTMKSCCCNRCSMWFSIVLLKYTLPWKISSLVQKFSKNFKKILINLTTEQFSTLLQFILKELWPRKDSGVSGSCSQSLCMTEP